MKTKILKLFAVYSYVTLLAYVGSENALNIAEGFSKENNDKKKIKFEWLWAITLKRFKKVFKLMM